MKSGKTWCTGDTPTVIVHSRPRPCHPRIRLLTRSPSRCRSYFITKNELKQNRKRKRAWGLIWWWRTRNSWNNVRYIPVVVQPSSLFISRRVGVLPIIAVACLFFFRPVVRMLTRQPSSFVASHAAVPVNWFAIASNVAGDTSAIIVCWRLLWFSAPHRIRIPRSSYQLIYVPVLRRSLPSLTTPFPWCFAITSNVSGDTSTAIACWRPRRYRFLWCSASHRIRILRSSYQW